MQPYAPIMHFSGSSKKRPVSRAERTCKEPYALYAPLLGVGPFFALFLLRELHTVHTTTYGRRWNPALALLPVGIETLPARRNQKCIRRYIRISGRKAPIDPLLPEHRDSSGMASEPMIGIRPCGPFQGLFRGLSGRPPTTLRSGYQGPRKRPWNVGRIVCGRQLPRRRASRLGRGRGSRDSPSRGGRHGRPIHHGWLTAPWPWVCPRLCKALSLMFRAALWSASSLWPQRRQSNLAWSRLPLLM